MPQLIGIALSLHHCFLAFTETIDPEINILPGKGEQELTDKGREASKFHAEKTQKGREWIWTASGFRLMQFVGRKLLGANTLIALELCWVITEERRSTRNIVCG